ncbi:MAG: 7TM diverse intracellular signaling domain-containing protein [Spirochaetota bacterium]
MLATGLFFGSILVIAIYNLFVWFSIRDKSYFYYVIYLFCTLLYNANNTGILYEYIGSKAPKLYNFLFPISVYLLVISILKFTNQYLHVKQHSQLFYRFYKILLNLSVLGIIGNTLFNFRVVILTGICLAITSIFWCFVVSIIMVKRKYRPAKIYLLAWSCFLSGALIYALSVLGFFPMNTLIAYAIQIGSSVEAVLLSLGLADKINDLKRQNLLHLEKVVAERTFQLNKSLKTVKKDLSLAQTIQKNILFVNPEISSFIHLAKKYIPRSEVGGDFYDVDKVSPFVYRIFLADATGHGVRAAIMTMAIKGLYDTLKSANLDLSELIEKLNDLYISKYQNLNSFMTAIVVDIDIQKNTLKYVSGGHPAAVLLHDQKITLLKHTGKMIGVFPNSKFASKEIIFAEDARLYIFTDGIFEEFNRNRKDFGEERVHKILLDNSNTSLEQSLEKLFLELELFIGSGEFQDDISILGIERSDAR